MYTYFVPLEQGHTSMVKLLSVLMCNIHDSYVYVYISL